MQIQFGLANFAPEWTESVVCIGTFDGVHLGHQEVIRRAVSLASQTGTPGCLLTFDRHPAAALKPEFCPPSILSLEGRLSKFKELGIALTVVIPFDIEFSQTLAFEFLQDVLISKFRAKRLVVGHDFAMGRGREGDAEWLKSKILTEIVPPFERSGKRVSSSSVRHAIASGNLEEAAFMLGKPFEIAGIVIPGDRLGRQLGYPTANIARAFHQVSAPDGVYAGTLTVKDVTYESAVSIGLRPSVGGSDRRIEAYCLDYSGGEFYGDNCLLKLHKRIRGQETFDSLEALIDQIERDVVKVRHFFKRAGQRESIIL